MMHRAFGKPDYQYYQHYQCAWAHPDSSRFLKMQKYDLLTEENIEIKARGEHILVTLNKSDIN